MAFTVKDLKVIPDPDPKAVAAAAQQIDLARQALLKAASHLDDSTTRHMHRDTLLVKDRVDSLLIGLTEWGPSRNERTGSA
jgi:hypothetical protein